MTPEDEFKMYVGAYFGMREIDEYKLQSFILNKLQKYIKDYVIENPIDNFDYYKEAEEIRDKVDLKVKLQDCLITLPKINASMELILLIKKKILEISKKEYL